MTSKIHIVLFFLILSSAIAEGQDSLIFRTNIISVTPRDTLFHTGLDLLEDDEFSLLKGKQISVVCHSASVNSQKEHILDLLEKRDSVFIRSVFYLGGDRINQSFIFNRDFSPENIRFVPVDPWNFSLDSTYLGGSDLILFDMVSIGFRFDPAVKLLLDFIRIAAEMHIPLLILDRPVPVRGNIIEGPMPKTEGSCDIPSIPFRYGLSMGELALFFSSALQSSVMDYIRVMPMSGYRRNQWYDWNSSRPIDSMFLKKFQLSYAMKEILKGLNLDVIIDDFTGDLRISGEWICEPELIETFNRNIGKETRLYPLRSIAENPGGKEELVYSGFLMEFNDPDLVRIGEVSLTIFQLLQNLYPGKQAILNGENIRRNFCDYELMYRLKYRLNLNSLLPIWDHSTLAYLKNRKDYLLYP